MGRLQGKWREGIPARKGDEVTPQMASEHSISGYYSKVCRISELRASGEEAKLLCGGQVMCEENMVLDEGKKDNF